MNKEKVKNILIAIPDVVCYLTTNSLMNISKAHVEGSFQQNMLETFEISFLSMT